MSQSTPLTFAELPMGTQFILFPQDGDDSGHGGYRGSQRLFIKSSNSDWANEANAMVLSSGCTSNIPPTMKVLKVI